MAKPIPPSPSKANEDGSGTEPVTWKPKGSVEFVKVERYGFVTSVSGV